MTQPPTRTILVAGKSIAMPLVMHRKVQALIHKGNKIGAIVIVRKLTKVELKAAKQAIENSDNFEPLGNDSDGSTSGFERVETMRQWITLHPSIAGGFGMALVLLSLTIATAVAWDTPTYTRDRGVWYYDLASQELYADSPINAPHGAVRAYVFACESCGDDSFVGFLEKFDDKASAVQQQLRGGEEVEDEATLLKALTGGQMIRAVDSDLWVGFDSDEGRALRHKVIDRCDGARPAACLP